MPYMIKVMDSIIHILLDNIVLHNEFLNTIFKTSCVFNCIIKIEKLKYKNNELNK